MSIFSAFMLKTKDAKFVRLNVMFHQIIVFSFKHSQANNHTLCLYDLFLGSQLTLLNITNMFLNTDIADVITAKTTCTNIFSKIATHLCTRAYQFTNVMVIRPYRPDHHIFQVFCKISVFQSFCSKVLNEQTNSILINFLLKTTRLKKILHRE